MQISTDIGHQITARKLMELMLYENGCINRVEKDKIIRYPHKHFDAITQGCKMFFDTHPELLSNENLEYIVCEEWSYVQSKFAIYPEYKELEDALYTYFEEM